jgi:hypothetical protein
VSLVVVLAALALTVPISSQAEVLPTLDYVCSPPSPAAADNCAAWHTSPVTLEWVFDPGTLSPVPGTDCTQRVVDTDTAGLDVTCSVTSLLSGMLTKTATVRVDQTPPTVTGAAPDRPPDHNGWYNHPVGFNFDGTDATSGIAGCDSARYDGPDTSAARVTGGCRDVAGNNATGSMPLKYDATPPTITPIRQDSKAGEVNLKWSASPDSVEYSVTRQPGRNGEPSSTVYTGTQPSYTDQDVGSTNNYQYQYTVTAADAAANSSSVVIIAVPGGSQRVLGVREQLGSESAPKRLISPPPRLHWRRMRAADYYNVQVFRGRRKILSAWPKGPKLQLHQSWRFRGKRFRLTPGRYHWYAWPGFGSRRAHRYGRMITHKRFTIRALR